MVSNPFNNETTVKEFYHVGHRGIPCCPPIIFFTAKRALDK